MKQLRKVAAAAFIVAVLLTALLVGQLALVPHTVENGVEISNAFAASSTFISAFQVANKRLPSEAEFESWKAQQKSVVPRIESVKLSTEKHLPLEVQRLFGEQPVDSFTLSLWRGDWYEHYAAWSKNSTIDSPFWLYASSIGLLSLSALSAVALWKFARGGTITQNTGTTRE